MVGSHRVTTVSLNSFAEKSMWLTSWLKNWMTQLPTGEKKCQLCASWPLWATHTNSTFLQLKTHRNTPHRDQWHCGGPKPQIRWNHRKHKSSGQTILSRQGQLVQSQSYRTITKEANEQKWHSATWRVSSTGLQIHAGRDHFGYLTGFHTEESCSTDMYVF